MEAIQIYWFFLIGFIFLIYGILDGYDLGVGILLPISQKSEEKAAMIRSISPFWDGNGVWLIIGLGLLFAIFTPVFTIILSGFYIPVMLLVFALMFRAISLEFYYHDSAKRRILWEILIFISSFLISLLLLLTLGNVIYGIPLNEKKEFSGSILTLFRVYPLFFAVTGVSILILHGFSYSIQKNKEVLKDKFIKNAGKYLFGFMVLFVLFIIITIVFNLFVVKRFFFWFAIVLIIFACGLYKISLIKMKGKFTFVFSGSIIAGFMIIAGALSFPNLIRCSSNDSLNVTIYNSSASLNSLTLIGIIAPVIIVIILLYTILIQRIFKKQEGNK